MLSSISYLPRLVGQLYRSGQAFMALRQLHKGAAQGISLGKNPGLARLASAMNIHPQVAVDVYMGTLDKTSSAQDIVNARRTLEGATILARFLAPLSRNTAFQAREILKDVARTHSAAVRANSLLSREMVKKSRQDGVRIRQMEKAGRRHMARAIRESRSFDINALEELNTETQILLRGTSGRLVD